MDNNNSTSKFKNLLEKVDDMKLKQFLEMIIKVSKLNGIEKPTLNIRSWTKNKILSNFYKANEIDKSLKDILKYRIDRDLGIVFNACQTYKSNGNGISKEDVLKINFIFIDFDFDKLKERDTNFENKIIKDFEVNMLQLGFESCYKAKGRGGYHYLYPVCLDKKELDRVKTLSNDLREALKLESNVLDAEVEKITQPIRLCETFNFKEEMPILNKIIEIDDIDLKNKILINNESIMKIKIKDKKIQNKKKNQTLQSKKFITQNDYFFNEILNNNCEKYIEELESLDNKNTKFMNYLGMYLLNNSDEEEKIKQFLSYFKLKKNWFSKVISWKNKIKDSGNNEIHYYKILEWLESQISEESRKEYQLWWALKKQVRDNKIKKLMSGDLSYIKNDNGLVYRTKNLSIYFDNKVKTFTLMNRYSFEDKKGNVIEGEKPFGTLIKAKKIILNEVNIKKNVNKRKYEFIEIHNASSKDEDNVKRFDLSLNKYVEVGKFIKVGSEKDQHLLESYKDFFLFLKDTDAFPKEDITETNVWGVFGKNEIYLPSNSRLNSDVDKFKNEELNVFEEIFKKDCNMSKVKETLIEYRKYLGLSKTSQIIAAYSIISPFRYLLMEKGLKEFGYLGVNSKGAMFGKTSRIKIINNIAMLGYNSEGYGATELKGTGIRLNYIQHVMAATVIDDPLSIKQDSILSILKQLGTSKFVSMTKGTVTGSPIHYNLIRPMIMSFNRFLIKDAALAKRFIMLNLDKRELQDLETKPDEDLILYLEENMEIFANFFWQNIKKFVDFVDELSFISERAQSKKSVIFAGYKLLNFIFEKFGIEKLEVGDLDLYLSDAGELVSTDDDSIKNTIKSQLSNITTTIIEKNKYNVYDVLNQDLAKNIKEELMRYCSNKGIYLFQEKHFLLTKQTLNFLILHDIKLKNITDLKQYFKSEEFEVIGKGNPHQALRVKFYGTKTGFLLKNEIETTFSENKDQVITVLEMEIRKHLSKIKSLENENSNLKKRNNRLHEEIIKNG